MKKKMRIIDDEYKGMSKGYMMGKGNCNLKDATAEYDAMVESLNEEQLNEEDADPVYEKMEIKTLSKELTEKRKHFGFFHVLVIWFVRRFLER